MLKYQYLQIEAPGQAAPPRSSFVYGRRHMRSGPKSPKILSTSPHGKIVNNALPARQLVQSAGSQRRLAVSPGAQRRPANFVARAGEVRR